MHTHPLPTLQEAQQPPVLSRSQVGLHKLLWGPSFWMEDGPNNWFYQRIKDKKTPYQTTNCAAFARLVGQAEHIIDLGANVGMMSVQYSALAKRVSAFEPTPATAEMLAKNLVLNNCTNVTIYPYAIYDADTQVRFRSIIDNYGVNAIRENPTITARVTDKSSYFNVEARKLDSFKFDDVSAIKIDIEGGEHKALLGAEQTILKWKPIVQVELMKTTTTNFTYRGRCIQPQDTYDWFVQRDYVALDNKLRFRHPTQWEYIKNNPDVFFVHKDAPVLRTL